MSRSRRYFVVRNSPIARVLPLTNPSEDFVTHLCTQTFLALWTYPTPPRDDGKELCDLLVVCDPAVLIFSVKHVKLQDEGVSKVAYKRWIRRAITASVKQIKGAERRLDVTPQRVRHPGRYGLIVPPKDRRCIHRIAVAFGARRRLPIISGDDGQGFVHVFDEISLPLVLRELDTITDFVNYLQTKEDLFDTGRIVVAPGEEHLLATYLMNERSFPSTNAPILQVEDIWDDFTTHPEVAARRELDRPSYVWDSLINSFTKPGATRTKLPVRGDDEIQIMGAEDEELDIVLRIMARETRFARRMLGRDIKEFIDQAYARDLRARMVSSPSKVLYVFLATDPEEDLRHCHVELVGRCLVARSINPDEYQIVVGISISMEDRSSGEAMGVSAVRVDVPWNSDLQRQAEYAREQFAWFKNGVVRGGRELEYPEN